MNCKITLRAPEPDDVDRMYLWENLPGIWRHGSTQGPLSRHQIWEYVTTYDANPLASGQLRLIVNAGGEAAGMVDLYDIDGVNRRAKVGIMIDEKHRGGTLALEALRIIGEYASARLGLHQLAAIVADDNEPSKKLFTSAGYKNTATLPEWLRRGDRFIPALIFQKSVVLGIDRVV
ncbi:MAG: GNAT family N-acetyltransferase [Muribaculaceae bacterium]|nr:GNAT family N-acetyltransferase [Muribaculaceae bacterium]